MTAAAPGQMLQPVVIKVGGSFIESGRAQNTLALIAQSSRPIVIVPGGGPFADAIRAMYVAGKFDMALAHRLAMLAMHQMAEVFAASEPRLRIVNSLDSIAATHAAGGVPVWVPLPMMDGDLAIATDWTTTSDTLAARLAELLGGVPLVVLKSCTVAPDQSAEALGDAGIVDRAFAAFVQRAGLAWRVLGPECDAELAAILRPDPRHLAKS